MCLCIFPAEKQQIPTNKHYLSVKTGYIPADLPDKSAFYGGERISTGNLSLDKRAVAGHHYKSFKL